MDAMVISSNEDLRKLTKVKSYVLGLFAFNLVFSAVGIWLFFYAGAYIITLLFHQVIVIIAKGFLSILAGIVEHYRCNQNPLFNPYGSA